MSDSDGQQNLPAVPQPTTVHSLEMPVAEFEGEMVRVMHGKLPGITLEMEYGYRRDTHLKLEIEVRVKRVSVDEMRGRNAGDLVRIHEFAIEEAKIIGAYTADELDQGVGGGLAASGSDIEDEEQKTDDRPEQEQEDGQQRGAGEDGGDGAGQADDGGDDQSPDGNADAPGAFDPGF